MSNISNIVDLKTKSIRQQKIHKACTDLLWLARECCDWPAISEEFHGSICRERDDNRDHLRTALFGPRMSYKTTLLTVEIAQEIIRNPEVTIFYVHHRLPFASKILATVANYFVNKPKVRELLEPRYRPGGPDVDLGKRPGGMQGEGKYWTAHEFTLPGLKSKNSKMPTLMAYSINQQLTSTHPDIMYLDDIVNPDSVKEFEGGANGIRDWVASTLTTVMGPRGKVRLLGTFWSDDDYHSDICKSEDWLVQVRGLYEDQEGKPCQPEHGGTLVPLRHKEAPYEFYTNEEAEQLRRDSGQYWDSQYMMIPPSRGHQVWDPEQCEHYVKFDEVRGSLQAIAMLMDPAPLGADNINKVIRPDKDYWSIAIVGYGHHPETKRPMTVLLDGRASQSWHLQDGLQVCRELALKWRPKVIGYEDVTRGGLLGGRITEVFTKNRSFRTAHYRPRVVLFANSNKKDAKAMRIVDLAYMAKNADFYISDDYTHKKYNMDQEFLGLFQEQMRPYTGAKSTLHDDVPDSIAFCQDENITNVIRLPRLAPDYGPLTIKPKPRHTVVQEHWQYIPS